MDIRVNWVLDLFCSRLETAQILLQALAKYKRWQYGVEPVMMDKTISAYGWDHYNR